MELIFIHGPAASGKLTIARELGKLTGLAVFHNHLVVDAAMSVFEFGSPQFVDLRHRWWLDMFREAARAGRSLIFTFSPESSVPVTFVDETVELIESFGGEVVFVRLLVSPEGQEGRIENESRAEFGKLRSVDVLREIRERNGSRFPELPEPRLTIDTESVSVHDAANLIRNLLRTV